MTKMKVMYIDDDASKRGFSLIEPMIDTLEESGLLEIVPKQSGPFDKITEDILKEINNYDAIIFDYQLDDSVNDSGEKGNVKAPVIAQHLRTEATDAERNIKDLPFILCSTDDKLQKSYSGDRTSHDLFDLRFQKDKGDILQISTQITSLIKGYGQIRSTKDFNELLQFDIRLLDERIFTRFIDQHHIPAHEYARMILKDLLFINGPLIDEATLAARVGININQSKDWSDLRDKVFVEALYQGIFHEGWKRWWMHSIDDLFTKLTDSTLASVDANVRVELLSNKLSMKNLKAADRIEGCNSFRYWTVCRSYNRPLDPREGFKAACKIEPQPWQDYAFISKHGAVNRINFEKGLDVHPSDYERYRLTLESLKNGEGK